MARSDTYHLACIRWQAFATLTFATPKTQRMQDRMIKALTTRVERRSELPDNSLVWLSRQEPGEIGGREHWHMLLAGLPEWFIDRFVCRPRSAFGVYWEQVGGGFVRTRRVEGCNDPALDYTLDSLRDLCDGAQDYETWKFGKAGRAVYSDALRRLLARQQERDPNVGAWRTVSRETGPALSASAWCIGGSSRALKIAVHYGPLNAAKVPIRAE